MDKETPNSGEVTRVLEAIRAGEESAKAALYTLVYDELRRMAKSRMRRGAYDTLQPTALVHEAFLKLLKGESQVWEDRAHFFGAAAEAMRQILIDRARARTREKRGGGAERVELRDEMAVEHQKAVELLELDLALERLAGVQAELANVVKLRYFAGLTIEEVADVLDVSPRSVDRMWHTARAWLKQQMAAAH